MHGLVNRSIQSFLREAYGPSAWSMIVKSAEIGIDGFEPMLTYPADQTEAILTAACRTLSMSRSDLLESLGTFLLTSPNLEALRRLLRFGGLSFVDFLHSIEDLPDRARLALPDLELPELILSDLSEGNYSLLCAPFVNGVGHIAVGLLRAMADDYGALVLLDHSGTVGAYEAVSIQVLDQDFSQGKRFDLALPGDGAR